MPLKLSLGIGAMLLVGCASVRLLPDGQESWCLIGVRHCSGYELWPAFGDEAKGRLLNSPNTWATDSSDQIGLLSQIELTDELLCPSKSGLPAAITSDVRRGIDCRTSKVRGGGIGR